MRFEDATFAGEIIRPGSNEYIRCTFNRCVIFFNGVDFNTFAECQFNDPQYRFDGPAAETLNFLGLMYTTPGGRGFVEEIFAQIRGDSRGKPKTTGKLH